MYIQYKKMTNNAKKIRANKKIFLFNCMNYSGWVYINLLYTKLFLERFLGML